nr:PREDICTED: storkhead-box protein 1 isoform X2 [Anolis carolinensis]|eukprot:XP_008113400.1 PREDICTED: storkhead-box protein 1 isoform X2 [Anolis carolinensis]
MAELSRKRGDVSPVHMNPISQSQFVPLEEVLCCAISDMNAAHITVTQDTLLDQLGKHYPGIAAPTHDILYSTLGMLIKERKIYHTGEGYFIVTPNTYFISHNSMKGNKKALLEDCCPQEPSVTYLVSMEARETVQHNLPVTSHCRSCHCFSEHTARNELRSQQPMSQETKERVQKGSVEPRFTAQNSASDTPGGNHSCTAAHPVQSMKEKEKVKKFSFSLFWRSNSKKEKSKKNHSSFSAQFPPEEWPVRDEDNLDNIPRDVEHEIIKRINPVLTVNNLTKHTVLMQKIEEQKKYVSKGTSTEMLTMKHKHLSRRGTRKKQSKAAKHHRKNQSNKEKQNGMTQKDFKTDEVTTANVQIDNAVELPFSCITMEACNKQLSRNSTEINPHFIYKKEIDNPFQNIPYRRSKSTKEHKRQKNGSLKPRTSRLESFQRNVNSSRVRDSKTKQSFTVKCDVNYEKKKKLHYSLDQGSEQDGKNRYLRESATCKHGGVNPKSVAQIQVASHTYTAPMDEGAEKTCSQNSSQTHLCDQPGAYGLQDQHFDHLQNACFPSDTDDVHPFEQSEDIVAHREGNDLKNELKSDDMSKWLESINQQYKGLTYDVETACQKVNTGDVGCSSLYHSDEHEQHTELSKLQSSQLPFSSLNKGIWDNIEQELGIEEYRTGMDKVNMSEHDENEFNNLPRSKGILKEYLSLTLDGQSCICQQIPPFAFKKNEERDKAYDYGQMSGIVEPRVFDFYDVHEAETRIWQKSLNEIGGKLASLTLPLKGWEIKSKSSGKERSFDDTNDDGVLDQRVQHKQNHLEGIGNHSITGDSGIDSPRTQSMALASSAILDGLKKRRSFLLNMEGLEKTIQNGKTLTCSSLLQLTPVMNV